MNIHIVHFNKEYFGTFDAYWKVMEAINAVVRTSWEGFTPAIKVTDRTTVEVENKGAFTIHTAELNRYSEHL